MDALITAGGPMPASLRAVCDEPFKCLLELGGRRLIDRCLDAVRGSGAVDRICLVGPPALRESVTLGERDLWLDDAGSGHANFLNGLAALADQQQIVFCASDMPFVTDAGIADLVRRAPAECGFVVPIYRREQVEAVLPEATNRYVPFKEGDLTASSALVISPRLFAEHRDTVETLFGARKNFLRLFAMVGVGTAIRFALAVKFGLRLMSVPQLEGKIARILGFPVKGLFDCDPAFNFDIDHEHDWAEALALLEREDAQAR